MSRAAVDVADRIAAAKLWLVSPSGADLPYLSTALYALTTVPSDRVASATVDRRWRLYVNDLWVLASEVEAIAAQLAHLVWHLLADHAGRAGDIGVDHTTEQRWRTAADMTVAEVLADLDAQLPTAAGFRLPPGRAAEEYYALLDISEQPQDGESDGSCGGGCDGLDRAYEVPSGSQEFPGAPTGVAEGIRRTVAIEFREHQEARGTMPGEWGRWVADILDPVVPWHQVLHAAVRRGIGWAQGHADYTYSRISRRQHAVGRAVIPALRRPVPAVAVVVDTSGSVDDGLLSQALGEVDGVLSSLAVPDSNVTVLAVDAAVQSVAKVRDVGDVRLAGGGGTDMAQGIEAALACRPTPQSVIVLTDGFTPWPSEPAPVPVIAALLGRAREHLPDTPDWVQRVEVVPRG